jgi:hypothetical protein
VHARHVVFCLIDPQLVGLEDGPCHPGYYGAYVLDSAASVVITPR